MELRITDYFDTFGKAQKAYTRQLEPVCKKYGLTKQEVDVLLFLHNNPSFDRAADIVAHRGMAKSHVSLAVNALEDRGFLLRSLGTRDRRSAHLRVTEPGLAVAAEAAALQRDFFARLYRGIPEETMTLWMEVSRKVRENINEME